MKTVIPKVSIIIPAWVMSGRFFHDLKHFDYLDYKNYELLIVTDKKIVLPEIKNARVILTGSKQTGPAEKRDIGSKVAKGSICAFIDDDAYPDPDWIKVAVRHFIRNKDIIAVGGPGVTPPDDSRMSKLGGLVYESDYTSGPLKIRFMSVGVRVREIVDWPAYNFFIRKNIMNKVGGWESSYYGGEDTFICYKMLPYGSMIYEPKAIVYHHRRPLLWPHLKQLFNVGVHRGYFFKRYPETSRYLYYFIPPTLTIGFWLLFILSFFSAKVFIIFTLSLCIFLALAIRSLLHRADTRSVIIASLAIIISHMAYGIGFIQGLFTTNLRK